MNIGKKGFGFSSFDIFESIGLVGVCVSHFFFFVNLFTYQITNQTKKRFCAKCIDTCQKCNNCLAGVVAKNLFCPFW